MGCPSQTGWGKSNAVGGYRVGGSFGSFAPTRPLAWVSLVGNDSQVELSLSRPVACHRERSFGVFEGVLKDEPIAEVGRRHVALGLRRIAG